MTQDLDIYNEEGDYRSKSQIKREAEDLKALGREILELPPHIRETLPLSDELVVALELAEKIKHKREALRRQFQFIGKLLRATDTTELRHEMEKHRNKHKTQAREHHKIEELRDRLIAEGMPLINELVAQYNNLERQKLRQLVKKATQEKEKQQPPKAYREIFQYLKSIMLNDE
jgi:ribosome-associated protein